MVVRAGNWTCCSPSLSPPGTSGPAQAGPEWAAQLGQTGKAELQRAIATPVGVPKSLAAALRGCSIGPIPQKGKAKAREGKSNTTPRLALPPPLWRVLE